MKKYHHSITAESIPLLALPSVPFQARKDLPCCAAIYFVLNAHGSVLYVGKSANLAARWEQHHRSLSLQDLQASRIAWLLMEDLTLLDAVERACIAHFDPICNGSRIPTKGMNRVNVYVDEALWFAFRQQCLEERQSASAMLADVIQQYLDNPNTD